MKPYAIDEKIRDRFVALIDDYDAVIDKSQLKPGLNSGLADLALDVFFDLDRLWHDPECLRQLNDIVFSVTKKLKKEPGFDVIMPIASAVGSFGPLPWSSLLALKSKKQQVVLSEIAFGDLTAYPLTVRFEHLLAEKRIMLVKDVILNGSSVDRAARLVRQYGGRVSVVLTLVDMNPDGRRTDFVDAPNAYFASILTRESD